MNINFTIGVDGDPGDFVSLLEWLSDHYHQVEVAVTVPELLERASQLSARGLSMETGHHPVVSAVDDAWFEQLAWRQARRDHVRLNHDVFLSISCPRCGAPEGEECRTLVGQRPTRLHAGRIHRVEIDDAPVRVRDDVVARAETPDEYFDRVISRPVVLDEM